MPGKYSEDNNTKTMIAVMQQGSTDAFARLYYTYELKLLRLIKRILISTKMAKDILQRTLLKYGRKEIHSTFQKKIF